MPGLTECVGERLEKTVSTFHSVELEKIKVCVLFFPIPALPRRPCLPSVGAGAHISPGWPRTSYVDQGVLELGAVFLSLLLSAGPTRVHRPACCISFLKAAAGGIGTSQSVLEALSLLALDGVPNFSFASLHMCATGVGACPGQKRESHPLTLELGWRQ